MAKTTKSLKTAVPKAQTPTIQPAPVAQQPKPTVAAAKPNRVSLELVKPEAKSVSVAGSFNGWQPESMKGANGRWFGDLAVKPGRHEYLFVVDGQWIPDPKAKETVGNPFGGKNSVLIVSE
jgi:1,4-alpha-glucan branching enzyme